MSDDLRKELTALLNRHSAESGSDTPDWVLAQYLLDCLAGWDRAIVARQRWYDDNEDTALEFPAPKVIGRYKLVPVDPTKKGGEDE